MPEDDQFYEEAGQEAASKKFDVGVMARAYADAMGDKDRSVALYIKYRVERLRQQDLAKKEKAKQDAILAKQFEEAKAREKDREVEEALKRKAESDEKLNLEKIKMCCESITRCTQCGFYGKMKHLFWPGWDHIDEPNMCKCPKCKFKFPWYYSPPEEIKNRGEKI